MCLVLMWNDFFYVTHNLEANIQYVWEEKNIRSALMGTTFHRPIQRFIVLKCNVR
jgi:hypothetical protein